MFDTELSARHRSLLRAVGQGRAQLTGGLHPCLRVDGRWCDQVATTELVRAGLIHAAGPGRIDALASAVLTAAGAALLVSNDPMAGSRFAVAA